MKGASGRTRVLLATALGALAACSPERNFGPVARISVTPAAGSASTVFTYDATGSQDPEDALEELTVRWDWNGDGAVDTVASAASILKHRLTSQELPDSSATLVIWAQVRDPHGLTDTAEHRISLNLGAH